MHGRYVQDDDDDDHLDGDVEDLDDEDEDEEGGEGVLELTVLFFLGLGAREPSAAWEAVYELDGADGEAVRVPLPMALMARRRPITKHGPPGKSLALPPPPGRTLAVE